MESKLAVFYHSAKMGEWEAVDNEILGEMKESGLLDRADVFIQNDCKDIGLYEFPTIEIIDQFAVYHPNYYILYVMNKGVSRPNIKPISDWRQCMTYWNITKWKECVKKLDEGYDAVGINVVEAPKRHFQGNWWWAKAEYIKKIRTVHEVSFDKVAGLDMTDRHKCEFWVLSGEARVYCPYHHRIDPYQVENNKENYVRIDGFNQK